MATPVANRTSPGKKVNKRKKLEEKSFVEELNEKVIQPSVEPVKRKVQLEKIANTPELGGPQKAQQLVDKFQESGKKIAGVDTLKEQEDKKNNPSILSQAKPPTRPSLTNALKAMKEGDQDQKLNVVRYILGESIDRIGEQNREDEFVKENIKGPNVDFRGQPIQRGEEAMKNYNSLADRLRDEYRQIKNEFPLQEQEWVKGQIVLDTKNPGFKSAGIKEIQERFPERVEQLREEYKRVSTAAKFMQAVHSMDRVVDENWEQDEAWSPNNIIPAILNGMALNLIDTNDLKGLFDDHYSANGTFYYKGIPVGEEFKTEAGKKSLERANFAGSLIGGVVPYGALSGVIKKGVSALAASGRSTTAVKLAQGLEKAKASYPLLTEITAFNFLEETAESGIRQIAGQNYTFNDFLNGLAYGAAFGTALQLPGRTYSAVELNKYAQQVEKFFKENEGRLDDLPLKLEEVPEIRNMDFDGMPAFEVFREARYAYLRGTKDGKWQDNMQPIGIKKFPGKDRGATGEVVKQEVRIDKLQIDQLQADSLISRLEAAGLGERRVRTFEDVDRMAQEFGINRGELLAFNKKNLISDVEARALSNTIKDHSDFLGTIPNRISELDAKAASIEGADNMSKSAKTKELKAIDEERNLLLAKEQIALDEQGQAMSKLIGGKTEWGRLGVALRRNAKSNLDPEYWLRQAARMKNKGRAIKSGKDLDKILSLDDKKAINQMIADKDSIGLAKYVSSLKNPSWRSKALTLWKAGLLSSPSTQVANVLGTWTMVGLEQIKDYPAAAFDFLVHKISGVIPDRWVKTRDRTKSAVGLRPNFIKEALAAGAGELKKLVKGQVDAEKLLKWDEFEPINYNSKILNFYTKGIFGLMEAADETFHVYTLQKSLYEQAKLYALNEGKSRFSKEYKQRVKELYKNPTAEMEIRAIDDANVSTFRQSSSVATFMNKAGQIAEKSGDSSKKLKGQILQSVIDIAVPFKRTPFNVARQVYNYSPLGIVTELALQVTTKNRGQRKLMDAFGRSVTGGGVIALGGILAEQGLLTGIAPGEFGSKEYIAWSLDGRTPFSVKVGDTWVDLKRIAPLGNMLALGADLYKQYSDNNPDKGWLEDLSELSVMALHNINEQTFLRNISSLSEAIVSPQRRALSFSKTLIGSLVPSYIGAVARGLDPYVRSTAGVDSVLAGAQSKIPNLPFNVLEDFKKFTREGLPVSLDVFGRPIKDSKGEGVEGVAQQLFNPFYLSPVEKNVMIDEIQYLFDRGYRDAVPTKPAMSITIDGEKKDVNPEDWNAYMQLVRQTAAKKVYYDMSEGEYSYLDDELKEKYLSNAWRRTGVFKPLDDVRKLILGKGLDNLDEEDVADIEEALEKVNESAEIFTSRQWKNIQKEREED